MSRKAGWNCSSDVATLGCATRGDEYRRSYERHVYCLLVACRNIAIVLGNNKMQMMFVCGRKDRTRSEFKAEYSVARLRRRADPASGVRLCHWTNRI